MFTLVVFGVSERVFVCECVCVFGMYVLGMRLFVIGQVCMSD